MSQTPIELKGSSFTLSVVHLHHNDPTLVQQALADKISQAPAFLKNAPVVLNVASLNGESNWLQLQQAVTSTGLHIVGVSGCKNEQLKSDIIRAGLPILAEGKEQKKALILSNLLTTLPHSPSKPGLSTHRSVPASRFMLKTAT